MSGETAQQVISLISDGAPLIRSDLWRRAIQALIGDDASIVAANDAASQANISYVNLMKASLRKAKELRQKVEDERFKFEFRGKEHVLADVCGQIVEGIMEFEKIIDKGVAMDASGQAALPWAAIKLVLGLLVNSHKQNVAVAAGLATVAEVISYYAKLEILYFHQSPAPPTNQASPDEPGEASDDDLTNRSLTDHLRDAIVEVYTHILSFLSDASQFYHVGSTVSNQDSSESPGHETSQGNRIKSLAVGMKQKVGRGLKSAGTAVGRAIFDSPERYSATIDAVEAGRGKVDMWTNLIRRETQLNLVNQADKMLDSFKSRDDHKFLQWISDLSSIADHARISDSRFRGTGLWLLLREEYDEWKSRTETSALWLYGTIGTGKTTLMSLIIDSFLDDLEPRQSSPVIFFYCDPPLDRDQPRRPADQPGRFRTADQCARDMLRQLAQLRPWTQPPELKHAYGARKQLSGGQCLDFIEAMVDDYESITFVIDALDKCSCPQESDSGALNFVDLLERLIRLTKTKEDRCVRVLISTQGQDDGVGQVFIEAPTLTVHRISVDSQPPDDIRRFITLSIREWSAANFLPRESKTVRERAKDAAIEAITKDAATMYLWASLVLNRLRNNKNLRNEKDVLNELRTGHLPTDIQRSYQQIYDGLAGRGASLSSCRARDALRLLYCVRKPLSTHALVDAVWSKDSSGRGANRRDEVDDLIHCSGGLIVEDRSLDVLCFFHPSVEHFLATIPDYELDAHDAMAEACMKRLAQARRPVARIANRGKSRTGVGVPRRGRRAAREPAGPSDATMERRSRSRSDSRNRHGRRRGGHGGSRDPYFMSDESDSDHNGDNNPKRQDADRILGREADSVRMKDSGILQDFVEYSTIYWATHYSLGHENKKEDYWLTTELAAFLLANAEWWMRNVQKLLSQRPMGFYDDQVEHELEHCMSNPGDGLFVSCVYGFAHIIDSYAREYIDDIARAAEGIVRAGQLPRRVLEAENTCGLSPFHVAARFSRRSVLRILAAMETKPSKFRSRDRNYKKLAIQHALENFRTAPPREVLTEMFGGDLIQFQSQAMISAMANPFCAKQLVDAVRGDRISSKVPRGATAEESLPMAVVRYPYATANLVETSLKYVGVTEEILVAAAGWKSGGEVGWDMRMRVWDFLLSGPVAKRLVSEHVVMAAIEAGNADLTEYLLFDHISAPDNAVPDTFRAEGRLAALVSAVGHRDNAADLVCVLLEWDKDLQITNEVVEAALTNPAVDVDLLRSLGRMDCEITDEMLLAMAGNRERGGELLKCVTDLYSSSQSTLPGSVRLGYTSEVIERALETANVPFLRYFFPIAETRGMEGTSISGILTRAFYKRLSSSDVGFLSTTGSSGQPQPTRPGHYWDAQMAGAIQLLFDHLDSDRDGCLRSVSRKSVLAAVETQGPKTVDLILRLLQEAKRGLDIPTQDFLARACRNGLYGHEVMQVVTERLSGALHISQRVFECAWEHGTIRMLSFIFQKDPRTRALVTHDIAPHAAKNPDMEALDLLFRMIGEVRYEYLLYAATNSDEALNHLLSMPGAPRPSGLPLLETISRHCGRTSTLQRALDESGYLFEEAESSDTSVEEMLALAAIENGHGIDMLLLLFSRFPSVRVTTAMLELAAGSFVAAPEKLRVLLNRCDDSELDGLITTGVLVAAAGNAFEAPQALNALLMEGETPKKVNDEVSTVAKRNGELAEESVAVLASFGITR
ncbi:uncharacterized protein DNG_07569 [Cephalotrichum gorgonifer]|uniref:NACHT domain-containing protein n=1 Tax=Cephalotrichum gorgonifer TaxID=2041049 RepID=A0AAE8N3N3_9PEZI|nr:uncharacterized protein DNG_07569 [Cephalotrichum gorgonifer]